MVCSNTAVAVAAALVAGVSLLSVGDAAPSTVSSLSGRTRLSMTFLTTGTISKDGFKLVNTQPGRVVGKYNLPTLGDKRGSSKTVAVSFSGELGPLFCVCAAGDDAWRGKLTALSVNGVSFGGLTETISLSTNDAGYYPCQRLGRNPLSRKVVNLGQSKTCEDPIGAGLSELASSADANAAEFEKLARDSHARNPTIEAVMKRVNSNFGVGSFTRAMRNFPSTVRSKVSSSFKGLSSVHGALLSRTNAMRSGITSMGRWCNISPDGSTVSARLNNLGQDTANCVREIRKFAYTVYVSNSYVDNLPGIVRSVNEATQNLMSAVSSLSSFGDFVVSKMRNLQIRVRELGLRLVSVNQALKQTQSEMAATLREFADDVSAAKKDGAESAAKIAELIAQHRAMAAQFGILTARLAQLEEASD